MVLYLSSFKSVSFQIVRKPYLLDAANLNCVSVDFELSAWVVEAPNEGTIAVEAEVLVLLTKLKLKPPAAGLESPAVFGANKLVLTSPFVAAGGLNENIGIFDAGAESSSSGLDLLVAELSDVNWLVVVFPALGTIDVVLGAVEEFTKL